MSRANHRVKCTFCGGSFPAGDVGEWIGKAGTVYCCHICAVDELPRLLADSVLPVWPKTKLSYWRCHQILRDASASFWKAAANRIEREHSDEF